MMKNHTKNTQRKFSLKKWQTFFFSFLYGLQIAAALILLWIKLSEPNFSTKLILWFGIFDIEWCTMRRVCVEVKSFFLLGEVDSSSDDLNSLQHQTATTETAAAAATFLVSITMECTFVDGAPMDTNVLIFVLKIGHTYEEMLLLNCGVHYFAPNFLCKRSCTCVYVWLCMCLCCYVSCFISIIYGTF